MCGVSQRRIADDGRVPDNPHTRVHGQHVELHLHRRVGGPQRRHPRGGSALPAFPDAPSTTATASGSVTSTCGSAGAAGRDVKVTGVTLSAGQTCTIAYGSTAGGGAGDGRAHHHRPVHLYRLRGCDLDGDVDCASVLSCCHRHWCSEWRRDHRPSPRRRSALAQRATPSSSPTLLAPGASAVVSWSWRCRAGGRMLRRPKRLQPATSLRLWNRWPSGEDHQAHRSHTRCVADLHNHLRIESGWRPGAVTPSTSGSYTFRL